MAVHFYNEEDQNCCHSNRKVHILYLGNHKLLLEAIKSEDPFKDTKNAWCKDPLPRLCRDRIMEVTH